jgi:hypothetical protein
LYESKKQSSCTYQRFHCLSLDIGHAIDTNSNPRTPLKSGVRQQSVTSSEVESGSAGSSSVSRQLVTLEQCIDSLFAVEHIMPARHDSQSKRSGDVARATQKAVLLASVPPYLFLHLKRFAYSKSTAEAKKVSWSHLHRFVV